MPNSYMAAYDIMLCIERKKVLNNTLHSHVLYKLCTLPLAACYGYYICVCKQVLYSVEYLVLLFHASICTLQTP